LSSAARSLRMSHLMPTRPGCCASTRLRRSRVRLPDLD
jgi:hypothetical protein